MKRPAIHPAFAVIGALLVVTIPMSIIDDRNKRAAAQAALAEDKRLEYKAMTETIYVKPWDQYIECGVLRHDLRVCDARYWPGQAYPDDPIPGEKTSGIVWRCEMHKNPRPYPPRKECYADASDERKKAYPCPTMAVGSRSSTDHFCKRAPTLPKVEW